MSTIMIIEDDLSIGDMVEEALWKAGYETIRAYSGTEGMYALERKHPDLVLLDLMLPGMSGEELLPKLKGIPVIVVSAKVGIDDKVNMLLEGAVDYITKPFSIKELLARITVQLRSGALNNQESNRICVGDVSLDETTHQVLVCGQQVHLTKTEFAILKLLMRNAGQAIAKSVILERISLETMDCTDASLKQHISNLRRKLRDCSEEEYIEAIWGIGFCFSKKD